MSFFPKRFICWMLAAGAVVLIAGCGVPDQPTDRAAALPAAQNQTTTPLTTATSAATSTQAAPRPTFSPEELTQAALGDAVATASINYFATADSLPPAPQDGPRPVYPTSKPEPVGILNCESVDYKRQFATWSCWRAETTTQYLMVRGGGDSGPVRKIGDLPQYREDDATIRGGVKVCTAPRADASDSTCDIYWRPEKEGRLEIVAVDGMRLTLEAVTGSRYVFNVETRQWEATPAIPVPTATLLPGRVPYSTQTPLPSTTLPTATDTPVPTETPLSATPPAQTD